MARKQVSSEFKAKAALEAFKGDTVRARVTHGCLMLTPAER